MTLEQIHSRETISPSSATWDVDTDIRGVKLLEVDTDRDGVMARVLVPGYGICSIAREKLPLDSTVDDWTPTKPGGVTRLQLGFDDADFDPAEGLPRFLETVGGSLTHLQLNTGFSEVDFISALKFCPSLQSLGVCESNVDARAFVKAYQGDGLHIAALECVFDDVELVIAELESKITRLTRHLKRIVLVFNPMRDEGGSYLLERFVAMLGTNSVLEYMHLKVPKTIRGSTVTSVARYHNQLLP